MRTIESIHIQNYRGLRDVRVDGLGRVNLLVGRNGAGKTSLLEALALACLGNQPEQLIMVSLARGGIINRRSLESLYGDKTRAAEISMATDLGAYGLTIRPPGESRSVIRQTEQGPEVEPVHFAIDMDHHRPDGNGGTEDHPCRLELLPEGLGIRKKRNGSNGIEAFFLPCRVSNVTAIRSLVSRLTDAGQEERLVEILKVCDERVRDIRLLDDDIQVELENRVRMPLASLGDGANRLALMAEGILNDQANVILLDEIDSGLHHTVMAAFWDRLLVLMEKRPFQIFCTTHDEEMLEATLAPFAKHGKADWLRKVAVKRRPDGDVTATVSSYEELQYKLKTITRHGPDP